MQFSQLIWIFMLKAKYIMRRLFFVALFIILSGVVSCPQRTLRNVIYATYTNHQVDSICKVETIPSNRAKWMKVDFKDDETGKMITNYMYIKTYQSEKNDLQVVYSLSPKDTLWKFAKRAAVQKQQ